MEFTAQEIAHLIGGTVDGDPSVKVSTFAKIEEGHPGALSFLANPKYNHCLYTSRSSIILVDNDFVPEEPYTATLIRVKNSYQAIATLFQMVDRHLNSHPTGIEQPSFIDPTANVEDKDNVYIGAFAYVGKNVCLGNNVKIYPQVYLGDNVTVGDNTVIYAGVKIYRGCHVGKNCIIHAGAVIGADGFGFVPQANGTYDKIPQLGIVEIEDNVEIGANTTIDRAMMGATRLHQGVKLDNLIQIAHNVEVGENTAMAAQVGVAGSAKIGKHCMMAGQVGIAGHISVGDNVTIGAQSGVPNNVKDGAKLIGYPAVPAMDFGRQVVYIKKLPELNDRVKELEKIVKKLNQQ